MQNTQNTVLKLSEFVESGKKENGVTEGFVAIREGDTYVMKAFKNGNLTQEEFEARKKLSEEFSILASVIPSKKIFTNLKDEDIYISTKLMHQQYEAKLIEDDFNIGELIREYLSAPIYKELLGDDAPEIYLVKDDNDPTKIYLASKLIPNFTTVLDHIKNKTEGEYINAKGYERILAAQILIGELDIVQTGNFGVISKEGQDGHFGKIDHGKSLRKSYQSLYSPLFLGQDLFEVRALGIKIDASKLESELKKQATILNDDSENIESQIKERVKNLKKTLNHDIIFTLENDETTDKFHYDNEHFISNDGKTLEAYFIAEFRKYKNISNFLALSPKTRTLMEGGSDSTILENTEHRVVETARKYLKEASIKNTTSTTVTLTAPPEEVATVRLAY